MKAMAKNLNFWIATLGHVWGVTQYNCEQKLFRPRIC